MGLVFLHVHLSSGGFGRSTEGSLGAKRSRPGGGAAGGSREGGTGGVEVGFRGCARGGGHQAERLARGSQSRGDSTEEFQVCLERPSTRPFSRRGLILRPIWATLPRSGILCSKVCLFWLGLSWIGRPMFCLLTRFAVFRCRILSQLRRIDWVGRARPGPSQFHREGRGCHEHL